LDLDFFSPFFFCDFCVFLPALITSFAVFPISANLSAVLLACSMANVCHSLRALLTFIASAIVFTELK
jgi:hypothetical protein